MLIIDNTLLISVSTITFLNLITWTDTILPYKSHVRQFSIPHFSPQQSFSFGLSFTQFSPAILECHIVCYIFIHALHSNSPALRYRSGSTSLMNKRGSCYLSLWSPLLFIREGMSRRGGTEVSYSILSNKFFGFLFALIASFMIRLVSGMNGSSKIAISYNPSTRS